MIEAILWILFIAACLLVSTVILLQEGKGGGLGEAFGGVGQQTFGVKAAGINKFTAYVSIVVVLLAIAITLLRSGTSMEFAEPPPAPTVPGLGEPGETAPAGGAGGQPAGGETGENP
jgi:preprotein translocase subunit SecG